MLGFKFKRKTGNKTYKTPLNYSIIDLDEYDEINWWCKELSCTERELIDAVNKVGNSTNKVKEYFGEN